MKETFRCPDCGRKTKKIMAVQVFENNKHFNVCIDCYEDIHFERTSIWKECLKSMKCSNALTLVR